MFIVPSMKYLDFSESKNPKTGHNDINRFFRLLIQLISILLTTSNLIQKELDASKTR